MRSGDPVSAFFVKFFLPPLYDAVIELVFPMKYTCSKKMLKVGEKWKILREKNFGRLCRRS